MNLTENMAFVFQPDPVASAQYFDTFRKKSCLEPEKRLMLAVLEDAILCYQKYILARSGKGRELFRNAREWILDGGADWLFSFDNVCEVLGMDPTYLRHGLIEWEQRQLTGSLGPKGSRTLGETKKKSGRKKFQAAA